ncbi:MAG: tRNA(His) guanylyltransferase Thg1 family protein [Methanobrevibacter sp.]|uniref:tRNA(His) guanylyltransferase Thg1 family protein n=1 Tax=Methanobrevibacter sp. TaxID=66852 RepID=UPI002E7915E0|nr:tRNA(His) guanylyltransferase Thg1 family protein [Methanobrevibacter sp.]MEE0935899.1 tRNA(His) guanylyltransferase Thg1 family protein [Methanobrevibacter sp.]
MKDFEVYSSLKVPKNSKIIVRLDGRSFHKLARDLNLVKPYDENFYNVISEVCRDLFEEFSAEFVYTFSDEISLLLDNVPFDGRVEKINSVIASFTASSFVMHYDAQFKKPPAFDSRIIPINDDDILDYFKWRQDESWRNCVNSHGISYLKTKYSNKDANDKINGMNLSDIHEFLFENGINLNDVETYKKRGIAVYRKNKKVVGFNKKENKNQTSYRSYVYTDWELPIFSEKFFKDIQVIK